MKFSPRMVRLCLTLMAILAILLASVSFVASELKSKSAGASSHTYYVSKTGNNADGLSWATAWNELANINWSVVQPGDTILLDGGQTNMTYTSTLTIRTSGTQTAPITIERAMEAGHNGKVIIFGGRTTPLPYCGQTSYTYQTTGVRATGINFYTSSYITIDGTKWHGITLYGFNYDGVNFNDVNTNDTLKNIEIYDNGTADTNTANGTWETDRLGVHPAGSYLTFEQVDIHDNGQDAFQTGGPLNNITIKHSWLHNTRQNPIQPTGWAFNYPCTHQDGIQVYGAGTQSGYTIKDSVIGPGIAQGTILGGVYANGLGATINIVTIRNSLFLDGVEGTDILGYSNIKESNWTIDHVTAYSTNGALDIEGTGHAVTNSIFYRGRITLPDGLTTSSANCQWSTIGDTSTIVGQTTDPKFVTDVSQFPAWPNYPSIDQLTNADFSLQASSPCAGAGSSIISVAQLINTAATSQPAPTAAPTDTPVSTTVPTSIPTPQPTSTPTPILLTPTVTQTPTPLPPDSSDLVLYGDAGATGFVDRSFGYSSRNPCDTSMFVSPPCSYAISYTAYGGINFYHPGGTISTASYQTLQYDLNTNNQPITDFSALFLDSHGRVIKQIRLSSADVTAQLPEGWVQISIPLSLLNPANVPITGIQLKNRTGRLLAPIHVDDVQLVGF